jgi:3D (Asp-Asp-Asp) domain-containing protein
MRWLTVLFLVGCTGEIGAPQGPDAGTPDAVPTADVLSPGDELGSFQLTYYWVTTEEEFTGTADTDIFDSSCGLLATVTAAFADSLSLEGTGRLTDGRLLNVDGTCACAYSPCFVEVDDAHPWGYGVQSRALVPFRSVAVDRDVIPYGTRLYLAEMDGVMMPGDEPWGDFLHDGCVSADDTGGGIDGTHVDFFAALRVHYRTLDGELGLDRITVFAGGSLCATP